MADIGTLSIKVNASATEATSGIRSLTTALRSMQTAISKMDFGKLTSQLAKITDASKAVNDFAGAIERAIAAIRELSHQSVSMGKVKVSVVASDIRDVGKASNHLPKATSRLSDFGSSLMRIAKYRFLRTIIKSITQGFSEGTQHLYAYSEALNSADAAANKSTMDQYASSLLYLKNAAGAAAGPLLQSLLPVVQQLVDWFVAGANAINQFISALQGKSTFTKAVYTMTEFGDETKKATGAAKELKKTVMGFDELNLLQVDNGRGGGSSAETPDYSKMFEEAEIEGWATSIAEALQPFMDWFSDLDPALQLIAGIGAAMLLWKIPGAVVNFFSTLLAKGTTAAVGGLGTLMSGAFGGVATGAALAGAAVGLFWWHMEKGKQQWESSEEYKELQESLATIERNADEAKTAYQEFKDEVAAWGEKFETLETARDLIEKIFEIYDKPVKDDNDIATMIGLIETLNGLGLDGITLEYDELTGEISMTKEEILNVVRALDEQYKMEAKKQLLIKAYKTLFTLEDRLNNIEAERAKNMELLAEAEKDFKNNNPTGTVDIGGFTLGMVGGEAGYFGTETAWDAYDARRVDSYRQSIEDADKEIEEINGDLADVNRTITYLNHNDFSKVFNDGAQAADNASTSISGETEEIGKYNTATKGARKSAVGFADENERIGGIKLDLSDEEMDTFKESTDDATESLGDFKDETVETRQKEINLKSTTNAFGEKLDEYGNTVDEATGKTKNFGTSVKNVDGKLYDAKGNAIDLHDAIQKLVEMRTENNGAAGVTQDIEDNLKNAKDYCESLLEKMGSLEEMSMQDYIDNLIDARDALYDAKTYAYNLYDNLNKASKYRLRKMDQYALENAYVDFDPTYNSQFASGGWPDEGQLFLAREAGPEMVGSIGGRTAVATNSDIVQAVSEGVFNAVMSANGGSRNGGGGDVHVVLQLDDYQFGNAVIKSVNSNTRRTGQLQIEGI